MKTENTQAAPARFKTYDEPITMEDKRGDEHTYRLRIWEGSEATPIVLVSSYVVGEAFPPFLMTVKLANYVNECILGHPINGMIYYEDDLEKLSVVHFEFFGNSHRLRFFKPEKIEKEWATFNAITGGGTER